MNRQHVKVYGDLELVRSNRFHANSDVLYVKFTHNGNDFFISAPGIIRRMREAGSDDVGPLQEAEQGRWVKWKRLLRAAKGTKP